MSDLWTSGKQAPFFFSGPSLQLPLLSDAQTTMTEQSQVFMKSLNNTWDILVYTW